MGAYNGSCCDCRFADHSVPWRGSLLAIINFQQMHPSEVVLLVTILSRLAAPLVAHAIEWGHAMAAVVIADLRTEPDYLLYTSFEATIATTCGCRYPLFLS